MATATAWAGFSKRKNSTKQPSATGTSITLTLKDDTSIMQPVFIFGGNYFTYNYVQFAGRYYYVDDVVSLRNNLVEVHCNIDVLATYKAAIQATSAYVLYYTHNNTEITDHRLSTKTTQVTQSDSGSFDYFGVGFTHVLTTIGENHVNSYKLNLSEIQDIVSTGFFQDLDNEFSNVPAIDTTSVESAISDSGRFIVDLLKSTALAATYVGSISDCIRNCYVLPIDPAAWGGSLESVYLGKHDTGKDGYVLSSLNRVLHDSATVPIPWQASDWRRNAPYHEIYLYIPAIGLTTISPSDVIGETALHIDVEIDKLSGDAIFNVGTASKVLAQYTTNVAVNFPIGASNIDPSRAAMAIGNTIGSVLSGDIGRTLSDSLGLANALQPQPMSIGSNGGGAFLGLVSFQGKKVYCFTVFHDTTVSPGSVSAIKGTPYNGVLALSGVSGYVQTAGASVDIAGYGNEKDMINNYLNGGIYIE